jgi:IS30 family transposase
LGSCNDRVVFYRGNLDPAGTIRSQQKDKVFVVLDRLGSVIAAAAELGSERNTYVQPAWRAGIAGKPGMPPHPGRGEFIRLRKTGSTRREAASAVGVNIRTARDWDKGIRSSDGRRIYPDGRVINYT